MGSNLALRTAKPDSAGDPKAVVDFFGPITMAPFGGLGTLPPIQIHHGEDDPVVPPSQSKDLVDALVAAGKVRDRDFEAYFYAHEGHGFTGTQAITDSKTRTIQFLEAHLS